jgi:dTDP-4-amino-4,6-dideoxygalactose transaminase
MNFEIVTEFENKIAKFFGAPCAVAVDSCTHGIELCLRYKKTQHIHIPRRTYLSVPMLANKLGIGLSWWDDITSNSWIDSYFIGDDIIDGAVLWKRNSYTMGTMLNISFQRQKHLSTIKGGMILLDDKAAAIELKKMSYDGRLPNIPWREQNIACLGFHYYMAPETAQLGLDKLGDAINTKPKQWLAQDWPDLTKMPFFQNNIF